MYAGTKLKEILRDKGMTQRKLMELMGWKGANSVTNFMTGNPTAENLDKVASLLGVSVAAFFDEGDRGGHGYLSGNKDNHNSFNRTAGVEKALELLERSMDEKKLSGERSVRLYERLIGELDGRIKRLEEELKSSKSPEKSR